MPGRQTPDSGTKIPVLVGPTASGKSALALSVAAVRGDIEIVSADSRQIYRQLSIGTAKPSPAERKIVPHHCLDLIDLTERYSAGRFVRDASIAIREIVGRGRIPLVVGGTGFYLRALFEGLGAPPLRPETRTALTERARLEGGEELYRELCRVDPEGASGIAKENIERVIRALGCFKDTGRPFSSFREREEGEEGAEFHPRYFILNPSVSETWTRIEARTTSMIESGLIEEVRELLRAGYSGSEPGLRTVGYRETIDHLRGEFTLPELRERIVVSTRRYAKRQRTWIRHQIDGGVLLGSPDESEEFVRGLRSLAAE